MRGKFIVLEGADGSGTTSQVAMYQRSMRSFNSARTGA